MYPYMKTSRKKRQPARETPKPSFLRRRGGEERKEENQQWGAAAEVQTENKRLGEEEGSVLVLDKNKKKGVWTERWCTNMTKMY